MNTLVQQIHSFNDLEKSYMIHNLRTFIPQYTENKNGFFFNLTDYNKSTLDKIRECIKVILDNRVIISNSNKERESILNDYRNREVTEEKNTENVKNIKCITDYTNIHLSVTMWVDNSIYLDPDALLMKHKKNNTATACNKKLFDILKNNTSSGSTSTYQFKDELSNHTSDFCDYTQDHDAELDETIPIESINYNDDSDNESMSSVSSYYTEPESITEELSTTEIYRRMSICRQILIEKGLTFNEGLYDILEYQEYF
jgi:hypothetical protein